MNVEKGKEWAASFSFEEAAGLSGLVNVGYRQFPRLLSGHAGDTADETSRRDLRLLLERAGAEVR
jgi:hypothetical protein